MGGYVSNYPRINQQFFFNMDQLINKINAREYIYITKEPHKDIYIKKVWIHYMGNLLAVDY